MGQFVDLSGDATISWQFTDHSGGISIIISQGASIRVNVVWPYSSWKIYDEYFKLIIKRVPF